MDDRSFCPSVDVKREEEEEESGRYMAEVSAFSFLRRFVIGY
jgi:hypothetical protein